MKKLLGLVVLSALLLGTDISVFASSDENPVLGVYYGKNVPLFRRNGYRKSGAMIP